VVCFSAAAIAGISSGCSGDKTTQGELILAVQTDMSLPKDVDEVRIEVTSFGNVVFKNRYPVGAGGLRIPATLGILPGANARALVTIRVIAMQHNKPRMLREVVTTVPASRLATLRLPIQWLSDGSAKVQGSSGPDGGVSFRSLHPAAGETGDEIIESTCPAEQTNIAGECVDWNVDSETLPDYKAEDVFGGGQEDGTGGTCFDTLGCMKNSVTVQPDGSCTIVPPVAEAGHVNVALRLAPGSDGICDDGDCYIPLDSAAGSGWVGTAGDAPVKQDPGAAGRDSGVGGPATGVGGDKVDAGRIHRLHEQGGAGGTSDSGVAVGGGSGGVLTSIKLPAVICRKITAGLQAQVVVSTGCATKLPSNPTCGPWSSVTGTGGSSGGSDGGVVAERDSAVPADDASTTTKDASAPDTSVSQKILLITPSKVDLVAGQSQQFVASFFDGVSTTPATPMWMVGDGTVGTINPATGFFTAGAAGGTTVVHATTTNPVLGADAFVSVLSGGADAGTTDAGADAGSADTGVPDAALNDAATSGCTVPVCSTIDGGVGCQCDATCDGGLVTMICNGSNCTCFGGTNTSQPEGVTCSSQPAAMTQFSAQCLGQ
jgi:hypothetical protein